MAYAYITRIKNIRKHSNADRLQVGTCFGNQVIVSLDTKENDLGVYFPTDTQLGEKYATLNKLLRERDVDGKEIGGYLDPNKRNIRALKLRKEISDGLFMPLSSLKEFTDISKLKEGDSVDVLNGETIAHKYIPVVTYSQVKSGQGKKSKRIEPRVKFPLFAEHVDTKQFAYCKNDFKEGDLITLSLKMHGCFKADTRVKLWGQNRAMRINTIKTGDTVIGMNKQGKLVPSKVLNTFNNGKTTDWLKLEISRNGLAGEPLSKIECTPNHKFWSEEYKQYIEAKDLDIGQKVHIVKKSLLLTNIQKQILLGLSVGDGHYSTRAGSAKIEFSHKKEHEELLKTTIKALGNICKPDINYYKSGYGSDIARASTKELASILNYLKQHRNTTDNDNKLKESFINEFSVISLAYLYMSDGSLTHHPLQQDRASIAICSFNEHDAVIIKKAIDKLGYNVVLYKDSRGYHRLRFNTDDAKKLFADISKYMPHIVRYKLSEEYRHLPYDELSEISEEGYEFLESVIMNKTIIKSKRGQTKYDIETETHNYVVGDVVVHNSSGRTSHSLQRIYTKPTLLNKILLKLNLKKPYTESYGVVSGTRRVTLTNYDGGYYGSDEFRSKYHIDLENKLHKGETLYYEIVGYTGNGDQTIMAKCSNDKVQDKAFSKAYGKETIFSYGCAPGENDMYAYRMTFTNEDGEVFEYPTHLVEHRCEEMGIKHVPVFERFIFTTMEDLEERINNYLDGPDPVGKSHIREGVVIRVENSPKFKVYKHKNFHFKVLEGLIKDAGIVDIEEAESIKN